MATALAERTHPGTAMTASALWNDEQQRAIREMLIPADRDGKRPAVSDAQMALFAEVCRRTKLDPFTKQIYLLPIQGRMHIHISIDGLRNIAARTGEPVSSSVYWKAKGGDWTDAWEGPGEPFAALCVVQRGGGEFRAVVLMGEFKGRSPNWTDKPAHQLGIVAERHALRKACPFEIAATSRTVTEAGAVVSETDDEPVIAPQARTGQADLAEVETDAEYVSDVHRRYRAAYDDAKALGLRGLALMADDAPDEFVAEKLAELEKKIAAAG